MTLLEEGIFAESFGVRVNTSFLGHFLEKICHVKFYNGEWDCPQEKQDSESFDGESTGRSWEDR